MDVLVLNYAYFPVNRVSWKTAFGWLFSGRAEVVDEYEDRDIHSATRTWKMPSIIRFIQKVKFKFRKSLKFNRKNVYLRDKGTCQYCGKKVALSEFTYDHVVPRSKGGVTRWENIVVACLRCNQMKRDRTPAQARMILRSKPAKPKSLSYSEHLKNQWSVGMPESWKDFMRTSSYWTGSLKS